MPEMVDPVIPTGTLRAHRQPRLRVGALLLRPWQEADVPSLVDAYLDPEIRRWHVRSLADAEALAWIRERWARWEAETGADWAVECREGLVGRVALRSIDLTEGRGEVAYWVVPAARGHGVAARALAAMTEWAFDVMRFHRLELVHSVHNVASCRVASAAGYAVEGTKRQDLLHTDGWHDAHLHARIGR